MVFFNLKLLICALYLFPKNCRIEHNSYKEIRTGDFINGSLSGCYFCDGFLSRWNFGGFLFYVRHTQKDPRYKVKELKGSPKQKKYAVVIMVVFLISLVIYIWSSAKLSQSDTLDHLSAFDDNVYIKFNYTLYHLNAGGNLLNSVKLSSLGIEGDLSDMQVLKDGSMLFGDFQSKRIRHCNMETLKCHVIGPNGKPLKNPFNFYADETRGLLFIIDTSRHELLVQDMEGNGIKELIDENTLSYPNDVRVSNDGLIEVADTDNHRIVKFALHRNAVEEVESIYVNKGKLTRATHKWPVAFIQTAGNDLWILNANKDMEYSDLVVYDNLGKPKRRIPLEYQADPFEIASANGKVLLTDSKNLKVYSINPNSYSISLFGDKAFQTEINNFKDKNLFYKNIKWFALFFLIISVVCTFALAIYISARDDIEQEQPLKKIKKDLTERELLDNKIRKINHIWRGMFVAIIIYIIAAHIFVTKKVVEGVSGVLVEEELFAFLKSIFYLLTIVQLVVIIFIRKKVLQIPSDYKKIASDKQPLVMNYQQIINKYGTNLFFSLALANSIGFYGLILCTLNNDYQSLYLFNAIAVFALILHRSKLKALEKLCLDTKQNIA
jgi:hypothetical protein